MKIMLRVIDDYYVKISLTESALVLSKFEIEDMHLG